MPTPVPSARQCLTEKAASALDDAVTLARRRGHSQTTSLHLVSSLLSLPNSALREACTRIRNNAYSARVQFKALELSLSVSLDRMPSSSKIEEPPVANSLMAAIKRSQANQRRQPENFSFYQQQQQYSSASVPVVRVELRNLILSILDDPLVSRVFGEAGFRSCDVKMATIRPGTSFYPFGGGCTSRYKRPMPPMFLCNIGGEEAAAASKGFSFPFASYGEEDWRRIGEVMVRGEKRKRNPLLMGVSANEALRSFLQTVERKVEGALPAGLSGMSVVCCGDEVSKFLNGECDERVMEVKLEEVERVLLQGGGDDGKVLVSIGDLNALAGDCGDNLRYLVGRFSKLLEAHVGKVWLIGAAVAYDVYFKFLNKFPSIEEDWDMEVLPITSLKFSVGGSYPRSSLMESFVPLGGFFSMPSDTKSALSNTGQKFRRCNSCDEKCQQEVAALSNGGPCASSTEQCQSTLLPWMQNSEPSSHTDLVNLKAKNDSLLLKVKIAGVQKKWDSVCQQYHHKQPFSEGNAQQIGYQVPQVFGFQVAAEKNKSASNESGNQFNASPAEQRNNKVVSSLYSDLQQSSSTKELSSMSMQQKASDLNVSSKSGDIAPEFHGGLKSRCLDSPTSVTSVTTELGLGTISASACKEQGKLANQFRLDLSSSFSSNANSYRCSDVKDPKMLYRALIERVSWQEEAIIGVTKAITQSQTNSMGLSRSDLWIDLHGPDILGKRKLAVALAEILYGSSENLICVDLSFPNETTRADKLFGPSVTNKYDPSMRGTVIDYMVEKLSKKPSVVFIENVDKADSVVQNSLSHAVKTGRLMDLRGREVNVANSIFLATTRFGVEETGKFSEEDVLSQKGRLIQVLIRFDLNDDLASHETSHTDKGFYDVNLLTKRKLIGGSRSTDPCGSSLELRKKAHKASNSYLDLNFPAEGSDISDPCASDSDSGSSSENYRSWLEKFDLQIGQKVVFRPFGFEALAERLSKEINKCLHEVVGYECSLEIEPSVMLQLLAAAYLSENKPVDDWIRHVLRQGFVEAQEKFSLDTCSVVKLVTVKGSCSGEQPETLLPGRIVVN